MAESKIIFYEGTQEEYDSSSKDENGIYFITDNKAIYKGSVKYSGESEIATPASPGVIKPGESFEVSSDGTLNLVDIPDTLFTPVKEEMKTEINKAVSESGHLKREVVDNLPLSGIDNVIYMKSKSGEENNIYDEYMWINQKWERIGSSEVDLSNYPTKQALEESMTRTLTEAKQYTDQEKSKYVPLAGNVSISNQIAVNAEPASAKHIATKQYVDNINASMIEAENRRETAEGKREASEVKRATAESQRALAETERVSSENARKEAETARVAAEQARQTAEENRSQTFSNSLASWEQQVSAETTKANQATAEANKAVATANKASETANTAIGKMNETLERVPIVVENILTGTATGIIAHADDVYASKALGFNVYGKSSQYTTTGANKFNPAEIQNGSSNGITWTKNENGSITVKGTSTALTNINLVANPREFILSTGKWTGSVKGANKAKLIVQTLDGVQICNTNTSTTKENKTEQGLKYFLLQVQAQTTLDETIFIYLEKSDKALYEEYTDGKPSPSPKYPREITNVANADIAIAGKNLVEKAVVDSHIARFATALKLKMELFPSTQYCLSFEDVKDNAYYLNETVFEYQRIVATGSRQFLLVRTKDVLDKSNSLQFDSINGCWIVLKNDKEQSNAPQFKNVQVEIGNKNTSYEASSKPITLPINLQGNKLCSLPNGVRDEVRIDKDGNIELVKRVEKVSLKDYVSNLTFANTWGENKNVFLFSDMKTGAKISKADVSDNLRCDAFSTSYGNTIYKGTVKTAIAGFNSFLHSKNENIIVVCEEAENLEQFKALLIEKNPVVYFELATPIITSLGKIDMPTLPAPVCNAWANSENPTDVKFSYIRDVNIAYEKLASALSSAMNTPTVIPELEL